MPVATPSLVVTTKSVPGHWQMAPREQSLLEWRTSGLEGEERLYSVLFVGKVASLVPGIIREASNICIWSYLAVCWKLRSCAHEQSKG